MSCVGGFHWSLIPDSARAIQQPHERYRRFPRVVRRGIDPPSYRLRRSADVPFGQVELLIPPRSRSIARISVIRAHFGVMVNWYFERAEPNIAQIVDDSAGGYWSRYISKESGRKLQKQASTASINLWEVIFVCLYRLFSNFILDMSITFITWGMAYLLF